MTPEELAQIIKESNLLPYEIAEAVYQALHEEVIDRFDYSSIEEIEKDADLMAFYLATKHLKD